MTTLELQGAWTISRGQLKLRWRRLTDADLYFVTGQWEELYSRIQQRTGETRGAIKRAIKNAHAGCGWN